jgi:hypothetical protein
MSWAKNLPPDVRCLFEHLFCFLFPIRASKNQSNIFFGTGHVRVLVAMDANEHLFGFVVKI